MTQDTQAAVPRPTLDIVSINYQPELTGIAVYSTGMANHFAKAGYAVRVFTGFPYYPQWQKAAAHRRRLWANETLAGVAVKRCYLYVPQRPNAWRRILHELSFTLSACLRMLAAPAADATIVVSPPLLLGFLAGGLARLRGSQVILHVQDLQPDAAFDLGMLPTGGLARLLFALERANYRIAHRVSTISQAMRARIVAKGVPQGKTWLFKNWADEDAITPMTRAESLAATLGLDDKFVVLYSGNLGVKQGLDSLLGAAKNLQHLHDIVIAIVGAGAEKAALAAEAARMGLDNVRFFEPVERHQLSALLATADVSVIPQKARVADLVLPSKLGNLLLSQRPIVAAATKDSELASIVTEAEAGMVVAPDDALALAFAIATLRALPQRAQAMGRSGRAFALGRLSSRVILEEFESKLLELPYRRAGGARRAAAEVGDARR